MGIKSKRLPLEICIKQCNMLQEISRLFFIFALLTFNRLNAKGKEILVLITFPFGIYN